MKTTMLLLRAGATFLLAFGFLVNGLLAQLNDSQRRALQEFSAKLQKEYDLRQVENKRLARELGIPLEIKRRDGSVVILDRFVNRQPIYKGLDNEDAVESISADDIKTGGSTGYDLTGAGQTLGEWDGGGVRTTHVEFGGRAVGGEVLAMTSDHSTHVAGTMIASGVDNTAEGFSTGANVRFFNFTNDNAEMAAAAGSATPFRVSNHSYGTTSGFWLDDSVNPAVWKWSGNGGQNESWLFGAYDADAVDWDNLTRLNPFYLIVKSAGNDRNDGNPDPTMFTQENDGGADGFDCIPTAGNAKNILTVGATNDVVGGYSGAGSVTISAFSGWGPTDDGRIKPDVVANGVGLNSCSNAGDNSYVFKDGTSMSAPSVTGTVGLLLELWGRHHATPIRSATMKGILIQTADECGPNAGPDYRFGWGLVNARNAAHWITSDAAMGCESILESTVAPGATFEYPIHFSGGTPLCATLVWTDLPGAANGGTLNPGGSNLVNNLDLRLIDAAGTTTFFPWILNPANPNAAATTGDNDRDNVEQIVRTGLAPGDYTVQVIAPAGMAAAQDFSLIVTGQDAAVDNLTFSGTTVVGRQRVAARNTVTIGPNVIVPAGAELTVFAGKKVKFQQPVNVQPGGRLVVKIVTGGGCSDGQIIGQLIGSPVSAAAEFDNSESGDRAEIVEKSIELIENQTISAFPNPTGGNTTLRFSMKNDGPASLFLTDALGKTMTIFMKNEPLAAGENSLEIETGGLPNGIYSLQLLTDSGRASTRLVVLK